MRKITVLNELKSSIHTLPKWTSSMTFKIELDEKADKKDVETKILKLLRNAGFV